jgi:hypothetical protein
VGLNPHIRFYRCGCPAAGARRCDAHRQRAIVRFSTGHCTQQQPRSASSPSNALATRPRLHRCAREMTERYHQRLQNRPGTPRDRSLGSTSTTASSWRLAGSRATLCCFICQAATPLLPAAVAAGQRQERDLLRRRRHRRRRCRPAGGPSGQRRCRPAGGPSGQRRASSSSSNRSSSSSSSSSSTKQQLRLAQARCRHCTVERQSFMVGGEGGGGQAACNAGAGRQTRVCSGGCPWCAAPFDKHRKRAP